MVVHKFKKLVEVEVDIKTLKVDAYDYLDDEYDALPGQVGEHWAFEVDVETGIIKDWPADHPKREISFKTFDRGTYQLLDVERNEIAEIRGNYVPSILDCDRGGYGDYIKITVEPGGQIQRWRPRFGCFFDNDE
jgi:hypothetical protein